MLRALAWTLLLTGVILGASGAVLHGADHDAHRAASRHAALLAQTAAAVQAADDHYNAAVADLRRADLPAADQAAASDAVRRAEEQRSQARAKVAALVDSGAIASPDIQAHAAAAQAAVPAPVSPTERLLGWLVRGGPLWILGVALIAAGALLARREQRHREAGTAPGQTGGVDVPGALATTLAELDALQPLVDALEPGEPSVAIRARIDALHDEVLRPVIEGRGQLIARHGLSTFAVYFGAISAGERNLARAWSALTDDHLPTARRALADSQAAFAEARAAWDRAEEPLDAS